MHAGVAEARVGPAGGAGAGDARAPALARPTVGQGLPPVGVEAKADPLRADDGRGGPGHAQLAIRAHAQGDGAVGEDRLRGRGRRAEESSGPQEDRDENESRSLE